MEPPLHGGTRRHHHRCPRNVQTPIRKSEYLFTTNFAINVIPIIWTPQISNQSGVYIDFTLNIHNKGQNKLIPCI